MTAMTCRTKSTAAERAWWRRLERLMVSKPPTLDLHADGDLRVVCAKAMGRYHSTGGEGELQPLAGLSIHDVDGGDIWQ